MIVKISEEWLFCVSCYIRYIFYIIFNSEYIYIIGFCDFYVVDVVVEFLRGEIIYLWLFDY